jgi:hypothetical protein
MICLEENIRKYKLGCLGSPDDERDVKYSDISCASSEEIVIPNEFYVEYKFDAKVQGVINSCVAHSISEAEEIIYDTAEQLSVGFVYGHRESSNYQGTGMITREALINLTKYGNVLNKDFPVNEEYPSIKQTLTKYGVDSLVTKASQHISKGFVRLCREDIKKYIATEKKPIIITVKIYDNFYDYTKYNGVVPTVPVGNLVGGHCMLITGYKGDTLKILNSWGTLGDKGYIYLDINSTIINELWGLTDTRVYNPIPTPNPTPSPSPTMDTIYRVQLEADYVREYADELANKLRVKGIDCCIKIYVTPKGSLYKVQVGAYKVYDNAIAKMKELIALGYKDAFIAIV